MPSSLTTRPVAANEGGSRGWDAPIDVADATEPRAVSLERIDETHANPRKLWEKMKRPDYLSPAQVEKLEEASRLESVKHPWKFRDRELRIELKLPPHSVAAITVEFAWKRKQNRPR